MTTTLNTYILLERLRQRIDPGDYDRGYCSSCECHLTATDIEQGSCTNCDTELVEDESADEHLVEDDQYDWYNANGMFDDEDN